MITEPWLRLYTDVTGDKKIKRIALDLHCERAFVISTWVAVLSIAKKSPIEGTLLIAKDIPATIEEIADEAGLSDVSLAEKILDRFGVQPKGGLDMVHLEDGAIVVTHWFERQFKSDNSTERVRQHRNKKKEELLLDEDMEQPCNVSETDQIQIQIKKQNKKQINTSSDTNSVAAAEKKVSEMPEAEKAWLEKIIGSYGEKFSNPAQVTMALKIRTKFGEEKAWEALEYYAVKKSLSIGEGVGRAWHALPTWGTFPNAPVIRGNGSRPREPTPQKSRFNARTAIKDLGWSPEQCRQRMFEMGMRSEEIESELKGLTT